ncbi:response regulator [Flavobacterium sp. RHBU_3]|uniref:response regulator n=1 Tax=Flavobacterium sp. RHBU_3 TaxID=3391184 RepID=UPI003985007A
MLSPLKNIYLADDDRDDAELFQEALSEITSGYSLNVFTDGRALIDAVVVADVLPDIIFIDVNMPRLGGLDALCELRENAALRQVPVIIYSTSSSMAYVSKAHEGGANFYFVKPSDFTSLCSQISHFLFLDWDNYITPELGGFLLQA